MEIIQRFINDDCDIIIGGDTQIGNLLVYEDGIKKMVDHIASNPNNHFVHTGDCIDGIMMDDKRFYDETINPVTKAKPLLEANYFIDLFKPVAKQTDVILWGNHDNHLWRFGNIVRDHICTQLNVRYGGYVSKIHYVSKKDKLLFKIYVTHGRRSICSYADDIHRQRTNMELILKRHLHKMAGDCLVMIKGHNHLLLSLQPTYTLFLVDNGEELQQRYTSPAVYAEYIPPELRYYGCSGSFLRAQAIGVTSYIEEKELPPVVLGYLVLEVRDGKAVNLREVTV